MRNSDKPGLKEVLVVPCQTLMTSKDPQIYEAYSLYLSTYVTELAKRNITIKRLTIQNEPHVAGQFLATYPCNGLSGPQERDFLRDYLGPRMRRDHPELELWIHDDQKDIMVSHAT